MPPYLPPELWSHPMKTQAEKAADFATLHAAPGAFVAPNPWDPGSARILAGLGFKALTTTSSGYARSIWRHGSQSRPRQCAGPHPRHGRGRGPADKR